MRGAGGAHAPRLSPPGGSSLRPEPGIESGRHQREAVDLTSGPLVLLLLLSAAAAEFILPKQLCELYVG